MDATALMKTADIKGRQLTFDDMPTGGLNPSVQTKDEDRFISIVQKLYVTFVARDAMGMEVSTIDLMEIGKAQYNTRLSELREHLITKGYCIDRVRTAENVSYYRIVTLEKSKFYAKRKDKLCHLVK